MRIRSIFPAKLIMLVLAAGIFEAGAQSLSVKLGPEITATGLYSNDDRGFSVLQEISEVSFEYTTTDFGRFVRINGTGQFSASAYGSPMLPAVSRLIEIPHGADVSFRVVSYNEKVIELENLGIRSPVLPVQPPVSKNEFNRDLSFKFDRNQYNRDEFVGEKTVIIEEVGTMRGRRIARMQISPFRYNPVRNTLKVYSEIEIEVTFSGGDNTGPEIMRGLSSPVYDRAFASLLLNYREERLKTYFSGGPHRYVILSHPMFRNDLRDFVSWKTQKGFNVIELYRGEDGVGQTPSEMRDTLSSIYHSSTPDNPAPVFLLIVGDHGQLPAFQSSGHVTDLYYATYDGDNDFLPDLYYGRFSANNSAELIPQIQKTLMYEKFQFPETEFLNKAVLIAGVDSRHAEIYGNGQINYGEEYYFNEDFGLNAYTYPVPHESGVAEEIKDRISSGVGFVNYTGHGFAGRWENPRFSINDVASLQNFGMYPLMIGNGCETNRFEIYESLGEALLRAGNRGAVGYIGASNDSYWDEDFFWAVGAGPISANPLREDSGPGFFDRLFHDGREPSSEWYVSQGQIQQAGNLAVTESATLARARYYWEIYHLMGDPSLMIYFSEPSVQKPQYSSTLAAGATGLVVSAEPYTYIALSGNDTLLDAKYTGRSGVATLAFELPSEGNAYNLIATRENRQPYFGTVSIAQPGAPYVSLKSVSVNDSLGNRNGIAEAGEMILLDLVLVNEGSDTINDLTLSVNTVNDNIGILDTVEYITYLEPGKETDFEGLFGFLVSPSAKDGESAFFTLQIFSSDTLAWESNFTVDISAPEITLLGHTIINPEGEYPGGYLMAGESALLSVKMVNNGSAPVYDAHTRLIKTGSVEGVNVADTLLLHGTIGPGETVMHISPVSADAWILYGSVANLEVEVLSEWYNSQNRFDLLANTVYEDFEDGGFGRRPWITGPVNGWHFSEDARDSRYSIRSGKIGHSDSSELVIVMDVEQEGDISFNYKLSSERRYDFLKFYIDNNLAGSWSGLINWSTARFNVKEGRREFRWVYVKDQSVSKGLDAAWIDDVVFPRGKFAAGPAQEYIVDVGVGEIISPESGVWNTEPTPVTFSVTNHGNIVIPSFIAGYSINSGNPVMQRFSDNLDPGETAELTFDQKTGPAGPGSYELTVFTIHGMDRDHDNDTLKTTISVPEIYDVAIVDLVRPLSGTGLGVDEVVEISLSNRGNMAASGFTLGFVLNQVFAVTETFTGVIKPGETAGYEFENRADLSEGGLHNMILTISLEYGSGMLNDTFSMQIENKAYLVDLPYSGDPVSFVYPNPFSDDLFVNMDRVPGDKLTVRLMSPSGIVLHSGGPYQVIPGGTIRINRDGLPSGIYFLELKAGDWKEVYRIVRQK